MASPLHELHEGVLANWIFDQTSFGTNRIGMASPLYELEGVFANLISDHSSSGIDRTEMVFLLYELSYE